MKAKSINVQIVKNLGNYESIRIGGEWELNGKNVQEGIQAAIEELEQAYQNTKTPKAKADPGDERVVVQFDKDNKLLQRIVKRVQQEHSITIEDVEVHYKLDDDARKTIETAIKLRAK